MADTLPNVPLPANQWVNLISESGVDSTKDVFVQNVASADVMIRKVATQPADESAFQILEPRKIYKSDPDPSGLWAKSKNQNALLSVQNEPIVRQSIPSDIYTGDNQGGVRRIKTATVTSQELRIIQGDFFVGFSSRAGVPVGDVYRSVISAAEGKYLIIDGAIIDPVFSTVTDGQYSITLAAYSSLSNGNSFTYTPLSPVPAGRALNTDFINDFPSSTIDLGVNIPDLTGSADYPLFFADFFIDNSGNRNTLNSTGSSFFEQGRQVVISPGSDLLVETVTAGNAIGTATINLIFFVTEIDESEFLGT